jgi:predicted nucleotidyltransferase
MSREALNEYDLGLPVPLAPLDARRAAVPRPIRDRLLAIKAALTERFGAVLREVRLFGSYARGDFEDDSDVDLLVLVSELAPGAREQIRDTVLELSTAEAVVTPLVLSVAELQRLRDRELILAQDLDHDGITV